MSTEDAKFTLGIDASRWTDPRFPGKNQATGVEVYCRGVIKSLVEAAETRRISLRLYTPELITDLPPVIQRVVPGRRLWTLWYLARELRNNPPDVFYTPGYFIPPFAPKKSFATIHDVKFKSTPGNYRLKERIWQNFSAKQNLSKSEKIITVSEESKSEIVKFYGVDPKKIIVVPIGYDRWIFGDNCLDREKTVLFVGRIEKKKSIDILIKAFAEFSRLHADWKLQLAGRPGFGIEYFHELVDELKISDQVDFLGFVDDNQKKELFLHAGMFVHPGAAEGSAIPLFEAWDAGTPAIVSDSSVMKEVGKDGAQYFQAGDSGDLATKMRELANNSVVAAQTKVAGLKYLDEMSWKKSGQRILNLFLE